MAEVHIIGRILGASGFQSADLCCRWALVAGSEWRLLEGSDSGQTQVDLPVDGKFSVWSHPIDVHYTTKGIHGWPKFQFQVFHQDGLGRNELYGYGFVHVPLAAGFHEMECVTWRPMGSLVEQLYSQFLGAAPQLKNSELIHTGTDRFRLSTVPGGKIHLELGVIFRGFENHGVVWG